MYPIPWKRTGGVLLTYGNSYPEDVDLKLLSAVGDNIPAAVRGQTTILEHMLPNNMLDDFYREGLGFRTYNTFLAGMLKQLSHRYPHTKILEIGTIYLNPSRMPHAC